MSKNNPSNLHPYCFGDLFAIKHGYGFKGEYFTDSGSYILLTPGNFYDEGGFKHKGDKEKYYIGEIPDGFILNKGDLIVAMTEQMDGLLGSSAIVPASNKYLHNQRLGLIVDLNTNLLDKKYLYYLFNTSGVRNQIKGSASGTKVRHTSPSRIYEVKVNIPDVVTQRRIADILSAYDDLIENNTRRIRILEQMAQAIYQEWFGKVDKESLPKGWKLKTVGDVLESLESGSRPKGGIDPNERGVPSIGAENIIGLGQYNFASEKYVTRDFYKAMTKGYVKSKDVLLYKDGAHIGRKTMFRDGFPHEECCINEHVFILRTNESCTQNYLFFWLDQPDMTQNIRNLNANAAQPGINQTGVKGLPLLLPDRKSLEKFDEVVDPILALLFNLAKKNINLRQTRDLLLPRLVSGEIELQ